MSLLLSTFMFISCDEKVEEPQVQEEQKQEEHEHEFTDTWEVDDEYHWHGSVCSCDKVKKDVEKHTWKEVKVIEPTLEEEGQIKYSCEVCGWPKIETIAKLDANLLYATLHNSLPKTREDISSNTTMTVLEKLAIIQSVDFSSSNLTLDEQATVSNSYTNIESDSKALYAYRDNNGGEAYGAYYSKTDGEYVLNDSTCYFQVDGNHYRFKVQDNSAKCVSEGHAQYFVFEEFNEIADFILKAPRNYSEFAQYLCDYLAESDIDLRVENITKNFVKDNNKYKFLIQFTAMQDVTEIEYKLEIGFTEDKLESIKSSQASSGSMQKNDPTGEGYYVINAAYSAENVIEFSTGFDEALMNKDLSSVGTISNYTVNAYKFINGAKFATDYVDYEAEYTPSPDILIFSDLKWYLDEECTREITEPIKCKSYEEIYVYAKVDTVPEDKAEVITLRPHNEYAVIEWKDDAHEITVSSYYIAYVYKDGATAPSIETENFTIQAGHRYYIEFIERAE